MPKRPVNTNITPSQNVQQSPQLDINALMASAQNIIQNITSEDKSKIENMDMSQMFEHVTDKVFQTLEQSGNQIDPASKQQMKVMSKMLLGSAMENIESNPNAKSNTRSKIDLGSEETDNDNGHDHNNNQEDRIPNRKELFEVLDSDTEVDELRPIADDLYYNLPVTLEELYTGKTKKLMVTRERLDKTGRKVVQEKRKIEVPILPGMKHDQEIRFNKEGNEKYGYRAGDIIITLSVNSHPNFERIGNMLSYVKNISLYESYAAAKGIIRVVIKHIDGVHMILKLDDGVPLHAKDGMRKVRNGGMPFINKKTKKIEYGDLYIRFNLILPESFEGDEQLLLIEKLFPVLTTNKDSIIYSDSTNFDHSNEEVREVLLEEVTPEDIEQLDYEEEDDEESQSQSDESGSE